MSKTNPLEDTTTNTLITSGPLVFFPLGNDCIFTISKEALVDGFRRASERGNVDPHAASVAGESPFDFGTQVVGYTNMLFCDDGHPRQLAVTSPEDIVAESLPTITPSADAPDIELLRDAAEAWCEWCEGVYELLEDGADVEDAFRLACTGFRYGEHGTASGR